MIEDGERTYEERVVEAQAEVKAAANALEREIQHFGAALRLNSDDGAMMTLGKRLAAARKRNLQAGRLPGPDSRDPRPRPVNSLGNHPERAVVLPHECEYFLKLDPFREV